jgi:hypothetical protein
VFKVDYSECKYAELGIKKYSSFRRKPESSGFNDFLDTGLRRHDGYKVNGTAVNLSIKNMPE